MSAAVPSLLRSQVATRAAGLVLIVAVLNG